MLYTTSIGATLDIRGCSSTMEVMDRYPHEPLDFNDLILIDIMIKNNLRSNDDFENQFEAEVSKHEEFLDMLESLTEKIELTNHADEVKESMEKFTDMVRTELDNIKNAREERMKSIPKTYLDGRVTCHCVDNVTVISYDDEEVELYGDYKEEFDACMKSRENIETFMNYFIKEDEVKQIELLK